MTRFRIRGGGDLTPAQGKSAPTFVVAAMKEANERLAQRVNLHLALGGSFEQQTAE